MLKNDFYLQGSSYISVLDENTSLLSLPDLERDGSGGESDLHGLPSLVKAVKLRIYLNRAYNEGEESIGSDPDFHTETRKYGPRLGTVNTKHPTK